MLANAEREYTEGKTHLVNLLMFQPPCPGLNKVPIFLFGPWDGSSLRSPGARQGRLAAHSSREISNRTVSDS
jgi:hypothetical protein